MQGITPLFFIGNKRSGTSLLVRLLNKHPNIYISHESDIIWILYCLETFGEYKPFLYDSPAGMQYTIHACRGQLKKKTSVKQKFQDVLIHLMRNGSKWLPAYQKHDVRILGDKKPNQQLAPEIVEYTATHFPDARFVHIMRHPQDWLRSVRKFKRLSVYGTDPTDQYAYWARMERAALAIKENVYRLKYEVLCDNPDKEMKRLFTWLGVIEKIKLKHPAVVRSVVSKQSAALAAKSRQLYRRWQKERARCQDVKALNAIDVRYRDKLARCESRYTSTVAATTRLVLTSRKAKHHKPATTDLPPEVLELMEEYGYEDRRDLYMRVS